MARQPSRGLPSRSSGFGTYGVSEGWCGRKDSNLHALAGASPSSWCVCQFRHFRAADLKIIRDQNSDIRNLFYGVVLVGGGGTPGATGWPEPGVPLIGVGAGGG